MLESPTPRAAAPRSETRKRVLPSDLLSGPETIAAADFPIVGIGASAGGLEACRKLMEAFSAGNGMAFILVQHLDPTHESMMVELLTGHTSATVLEAVDGMQIERDHLYVIPPGTYLAVTHGVLHLSHPQARHGARLPFDFLLNSLAAEFGSRVICVILSGTGADGSLGLKAVKEKGGLVIAQDPKEAAYDGMPKSAIETGAVKLVLPVAEIPDAIATYRQQRPSIARKRDASHPQDKAQHRLPEIIELLRTKTAHNFTLYKMGTLQRRTERRMGMAGVKPHDIGRYIALLRSDPDELDLLAKDLLINVTSFFRDPKIFENLAKKVIPDLVKDHVLDQPLRIWIPGCSTGEETYSLAMLFREQIATAKSEVKLQIFASDVDPDAVAQAREGVYSDTIESDVSPARLERFFTKEDHTYRVTPDLRAAVIFTVQDVLADPPFSRLDMVSCRNLLIYLRPEAQSKIVSLFHFALREDGILLLGSAEIAGNAEGRFEVISKTDRLYRRIGRGKSGEIHFPISPNESARSIRPREADRTALRPAALAELCRRMVMDVCAPAAVLINLKYECLYSLGPIDLYLKVVPGHPIHDLLSMAREGVRTKLRAAIQEASQSNTRIVVTGGKVSNSHDTHMFKIAVQPALSEGEQLLLVCFIDEPELKHQSRLAKTSDNIPRVAELEFELKATRTELQGAIRNLEISGEEQKAINEEALSVSEEHQATNEELLTSKEELQSLNEELTALNSQLQETLERQRTTSNDLQNVLYSTDVATLFLDTKLNIRFFTPATRLLFNVIPGDIGRPLADLSSLSSDAALTEDARTVLKTLTPREREIQVRSGAWYIRRILPYRTQGNGVEGVVITFVDITERKRAADDLEIAKRDAQLANIAKSRFLAAASHDLRQPLQTLSLLNGILAKTVEGEKSGKLITLLDETLAAMSGMLNALLDINHIEAGTVQAEKVAFPINDLLNRLKEEFSYHAQTRGIVLRVVPCGLSVFSDPRLIEQMIRNLLSNAMKYTARGKVLLGCRRRSGKLSIEVWDTGIGIPAVELRAIFDEYHQLDNPARERSRGLGLGLSIVHRLGILLDHKVGVHSEPGKGSSFTIEVALVQSGSTPLHRAQPQNIDRNASESAHRTGKILVIDDDPEVLQALQFILKDAGYRVLAAHDGVASLEMIAHAAVRPDLILADYNLPNGMDGIEVTAKLREKLNRNIPVIILTGDISTAALRDIAAHECVHLSKPVQSKDLMDVIQSLLPDIQSTVRIQTSSVIDTQDRQSPNLIHIVDDDSHVREAMRALLEEDGRTVKDYASCEAFLENYHPGQDGCLLLDAYLPGMDGLQLLRQLHDLGHPLPVIMITAGSDVSIAVEAMRAGASDFIEMPIGREELFASLDRAWEQSRDSSKLFASQDSAAKNVALLTARQHEIMGLILAGHPNKNIAADLGISQRTVENHRASIMKKTGSKSLPALARLALAAGRNTASGCKI